MLARSTWAGPLGSAIALAAVTLACCPAAAEPATTATAVRPGPAINLGGRGLSGDAASVAADRERLADALGLNFRAGAASDYIYRGVTLSDRRPAYGAGIEATLKQFYAGATVATVRLPTEPVAEYTFSGGVRPTFGRVEFDIGAIYFTYPGERFPGVTNGIDYWEAAFRADTTITDRMKIAGGYAWSPNVSKTGAFSHYVAGGVGFDLANPMLPDGVGLTFTTGGGYSWFGRMSEVLGGFPLPAYLNWQAGFTFTHKAINLDLRYFDTNLSREDCYVFTGDPNALPNGRIDPVTNPDGLTSKWCGATVVAKIWIALER